MDIRIATTVLFLMPLVFYDLITSIGGGFAIFRINISVSDFYSFENAVVVLFPVALSLGALSINFWTKDIWEQSGAVVIVQILWLVLISFDGYTTFLGVIGFMSGGGFFSFPHSSISNVILAFTIEQIAFAIAVTALVVMSPMCVNVMLGFGHRR